MALNVAKNAAAGAKVRPHTISPHNSHLFLRDVSFCKATLMWMCPKTHLCVPHLNPKVSRVCRTVSMLLRDQV